MKQGIKQFTAMVDQQSVTATEKNQQFFVPLGRVFKTTITKKI